MPSKGIDQLRPVRNRWEQMGQLVHADMFLERPTGVQSLRDKSRGPALTPGHLCIAQDATYSQDLNDSCFTEAGASEILRMLAQVCL